MKLGKILLLFIIVGLLSNCENEPNNASLTTIESFDITTYSAKSGGKISPDGKLPILNRGVCWSKIQNPTINNSYTIDSSGFGSYSATMYDLNAKSTYYVRAYYINRQDTVYGNQIEFSTPDYLQFNPGIKYGTVTDIDGNVYKTISIGNQTWMAENLRTTRFQNGDPISNITDLNNWGHFQITTPAYIWYNNDISYKEIYGALYNWYSASDSRKIAPLGWRVANVDDWQTLNNYLDKNINNGFKLRETSTAHWVNNNESIPFATNETGFTAIPGGKAVPGRFMDIKGFWAYYWTSTGTSDGSSCVYLSTHISIDGMQPNARGFNIRCVKE